MISNIVYALCCVLLFELHKKQIFYESKALKNARKYLCHTRVSAQNAGSLAVVRPCSAALRLVAFIFSYRTSELLESLEEK